MFLVSKLKHSGAVFCASRLLTGPFLVLGDRAKDYGCAVGTHKRIAEMARAMTGKDIQARDVALVLMAVKLVRAEFGQTLDSYVDLCGYGAILGEVDLSDG